MPAEAVRIVEYDPAWPSRFRSQQERVSVNPGRHYRLWFFARTRRLVPTTSS